jgi:hypothetical protein
MFECRAPLSLDVIALSLFLQLSPYATHLTHTQELENCYWTETLWIPMFLPTMATRVAFKLYPHFITGKGRLPLATAFLSLSSILDSRSTAPQWLNFYGPAIGVLYQEESDLDTTQGQLVNAVRTALKDSVDLLANNQLVSKLREGFTKTNPHDVAAMMAMSPPMASTYRGRLLVATRLTSTPPKNAKEMGLSFMRRVFTSKKTRLEHPFKTKAFPVDFARTMFGSTSPSTCFPCTVSFSLVIHTFSLDIHTYIHTHISNVDTQKLQVVVQVIAGAHLPDASAMFDLKRLVAGTAVKISDALSFGKHRNDSGVTSISDTRYFVEIVWGSLNLINMKTAARGSRGYLTWSQTLNGGAVDMVSDPDQVPDMFIYLVKANGDRSQSLDRTRLAFIRLRGSDLVQDLGFKDVEVRDHIECEA